MITNILLTMLAALPQQNVTFQITTDEFMQHNTYVFIAEPIDSNAHETTYSLHSKACDFNESYYNILDAKVILAPKHTRSTFYSLERKEDNSCILRVKIKPYKKLHMYNTDLDYWYPEYNNIKIIPRNPFKIQKKHAFNKKHVYKKSNYTTKVFTMLQVQPRQ